MVQAGGLEPPTSGSTDQRSNQLSYACTRDRLFGARSKRAEPRCRLAFWQAGPFDAFSAGKRKPGHLCPGLAPNISRCEVEGSGSLAEVADAFLDRLGRFGRHFLSVLGEFLGLCDQDIELLAQICAGEFDHLRI